MTQCNTKTRLDFHPKFPVDIEFSAPDISSDGGLLLLRQAEDSIGVCEMLAGLVPDRRDARRIRHHRVEQMEQRVFQICMGYEDCNDATWLRKSPLWKTVMGLTPESEEGLSSQPTLSRFENSVDEQTVEVMHFALMADFVRRLPEDIECLVLDLDSSAVEGFGEQQELFYNGFHDAHIFHPLMIIDGESGQLITAMLRPGNVGDARDADKVLEKLIVLIKVLRPNCAVCVRADAGFASPALYDCLEFFDDLYGGVTFSAETLDPDDSLSWSTLADENNDGDIHPRHLGDGTDITARLYSNRYDCGALTEHLITLTATSPDGLTSSLTHRVILQMGMC